MRLLDWLITPFRPQGAFHGGLHVPSHKAMSTQKPSIEPPLPPYLAISLRQIDGNMQIPKVAVGDRVLREQLISEPSNPYSVPRHAPTSGQVIAIKHRADVHPSNLEALHIVIEPDGKDESQSPLPSLDYQNTDKKLLLNRIHQCGIAGMGGAGFPTARKLGHPSNVLVVNAAECEPYITCDDMQMREHALEILKGAQIAAHILGAEKIVVGIENDKPLAIEAIRTAATELSDERIRIESVPTKYPSGNQRQLFELLLGIRVPNNAHATDYGLICHNSATMKSIYDAISKGLALTERYVTVTGEAVSQPQVFRARLGTPASYLVEQAGNANQQCQWIIGGPMMGHQLLGHKAGIKKTTNCILLLPNTDIPDQQERACIRCSQCATACPMELLPQQLYWYSRNGQHDRLNQYRLFDCIECGICATVCPSYIPLVQYFRHSKGDVREEKRKATASDIARARHEAREARLEREALERKARMDARRAQLKAKTGSNKSQSASSADNKQSAIEAAKARAAAKRQARLQQNASDKVEQDANDKLAAAKAKAEARRRARAEKTPQADTTSIQPQTQSSAEHNEREDKLEAAKAKAEARRRARAEKVQQEDTTSIQPQTQSSAEHNEREDKLAAAKAKAEARKRARAEKVQQEDGMLTHIEPVSTDKDAIKESEAQKAKAKDMAQAQIEQRNSEVSEAERQRRIEQAKARTKARRNNTSD